MKSDEKQREMILHPIPPLFDRESRILILGSFPSVKSREAAFFLRTSAKSFLEDPGGSVVGNGSGNHR